ncbi:MAG: hypothetical protein IJ418_12950 [Clostridia bacterium]|nr:hypothetical protein [Clostridia bacterium]
MEKKMWTPPRVDFVQFQANEYVNACSKMLSLVCNAFGVIFHDYNGNKSADNLTDPNGKYAFYHTFGTENSFTPTSTLNYANGSESGESFYDSYDDSYFGTSIKDIAQNYDQDMGVLLPNQCDGSSTPVSVNDVHFGFAKTETSTDYVFIWHNPDGSNIHASLFNQDAWNAANHS